MMEINIPGIGDVEIKDLILDYNGTIAKDGRVSTDVREKLNEILKLGIRIHVLTADTNNTVKDELEDLDINIRILESSREDEEKRSILHSIGISSSMVIGNGRNDLLMLQDSRIGVAIVGDEGAYGKLIGISDIVVKSILDALDLLINPNRLKATLRV